MTNSSQTKSDDLSLLKYAADPKNFRLHDVLYDWLRRQIAGPTTGWFAALARFFVAALKQGRCGLGRDSTGYHHSRRSVKRLHGRLLDRWGDACHRPTLTPGGGS